VFLQFTLLWGILVLILLVILYLFFFFYYLPHRCRSIAYEFDPDHLGLKKGVFFQNIIQLGFSSIIYTSCTQTLLQRMFKICTIQLHPIGKAATLPQISTADAKLLLTAIEGTRHEV
jgi:membrane protein YdbS with pleckstrin-like domain